MAITAVTPASSSTVAHADTFSFTVDDTYTFLTVSVQAENALEFAYGSAAGGGLSGYTTVVVDNGDGTETVTISRDAGWDKSPQLIYVYEDEDGTTTITSTSYTLTSEDDYPQGSQPYNAITP